MSKTSIADMFTRYEDIEIDGYSIFDEDDINDVVDESIENGVMVQGKNILDGADSLEDAAFMARAYADYLEMLQEQGYKLLGIVSNDHGIATLS